MDSIVEYYSIVSRYDDPPTDVQCLALTALARILGGSVQIPNTYGEAAELIKYLHNTILVYK
jgi:hypothetical protein